MRSRTAFALGLLSLNALNILDYLLTKTSLKLGAVELNLLLPKDPLGLKIFLVFSGSIILYACRHKLLAQRAALLLTVAYLLVVFYQILGIYTIAIAGTVS